MSTNIFLGEPPANIKQWIIDHATPPGPIPHADTRFTLDNGTVETHNITEILDQEWMAKNGYFNDNEGTWFKTITQADIGNTVPSIGLFAFDSCYELASVTIPVNVTSIGQGAFCNCSGLARVEFEGNAPAVGTDAFLDVASGCKAVISSTATGFPAAGETWNGLIVEVKP